MLFKNISSAIRYYAEKTSEKPYVIDNGVMYTYLRVNKLINNICSLYESIGLKNGDIVSAVIKNSIEYISFYLATLRFGGIFNPYPYNLDAIDIARYIKLIKPKRVFCQEKHYLGLKKFDPILIDGKFLRSLKDAKKEYNFEPDDKSPACVYYSSGTTGNPKSVVFSHKNIIADISSVVRGFKFISKEIHLIILPLGHTASTNYSFLPVTLVGGTLVVAESFWKIRIKFWKYVKKYGITYVETVPTIITAIYNTHYKKSDYKNIKTLKYIGCGSATLPKDLQLKFREKYGLPVANLYGLSETGPTHIDYPLEKGWKSGSIGKPLDVNDAMIIDEKGNFLGDGKIGEIVIRGPNVFIDYYENHKLYNEVVRDNWFHTGDLGYMKDGRFFFTGRKKDLIIKGGANISPDEIDEVLYKMESIKETVTVGVPDKYLGERIVSFIVLKKGRKASEKEIVEFCRRYLSREKIPNKIEFVDSIPKGPSGKLLRGEMRNEKFYKRA